MDYNRNVIGIDIGSIAISVAELSTDRKVLKTAYRSHSGDIENNLKDMLRNFDIEHAVGFAATSSGNHMLKHTVIYDSRISYITAARHFNKIIGSLLIIGGERFGLALFDEDGNYLNYKSNTSCAAGTGSFLDQQAARLNLGSIEEFSRISSESSGDIPKIASRCSVFAKTDLIHAQQEGYSLEQICNGLAYGLAKNVVDTLFSNNKINLPLIFAGGVSKNSSVVKHISEMLGCSITVNEHSNIFGAIGAAVNLIDEKIFTPGLAIKNPSDLIPEKSEEKKYYYPPLTNKNMSYPDFTSRKSYLYTSKIMDFSPVESDIYAAITSGSVHDVYLGIDIGSTSTKAILADKDGEPLAGFYTRTSGRPVQAVRVIFEAIEEFAADYNVTFNFLGTGTTGSGRKFIGTIIGADVALDEITAHARAACELDKDVDTIIEIGGQDSKFTTLKDGRVTFSVMNNVCAAGTGSFIEEQAKKLGCPLSDYSRLSERSESPMSSDRCTVFMERDLNHFLTDGYSVNEILASVLHSVRDNYLSKVAVKKSIGNKIFFQGATARNRALVAAFEQKLGKPVMVSKYCHLTGALGTALHLMDENFSQSAFRGLGLSRTEIPVTTETCDLCTNHCKIRIADVNGESVAFGFLCGRDYETKKFIKLQESGLDLLEMRKHAFSFMKNKKYDEKFTIGIPAALHLYEDLPFWEFFFNELSIKTITSANYADSVKIGKNISGAEFCSPMSSLHGHVKYLEDKADYIFLPTYLEVKESEERRQYCYYTQYASSIILSNSKIEKPEKILNPLLKSNKSDFFIKLQLYKTLKALSGRINPLSISNAYEKALKHCRNSMDQLKKIYDYGRKHDDINILFLGRHYSLLNPHMNSRIPEIFSKFGVNTYFHDVVEPARKRNSIIKQLLKSIHWKYGASLLEAAEHAAETDGVYPVLVTSFKCTPDAFVTEYFKTIMEAYNKPYLILQLDEHNSSIGYETRIESAIRAFRNHLKNGEISVQPAKIKGETDINSSYSKIAGKTLLLPNWDSIMCRLLAAAIRHAGVDARALEETVDTISKSLTLNSGQCLPLTAIAQGSMDYIEKYGLDPGKTAIWNMKSKIACNLGMIPSYIKKLMESNGKGYEKVSVLSGEIMFSDLSLMATVDVYFAYMFSGFLRKLGCKIRPYENIRGTTDRILNESVDILEKAFENGEEKEEILSAIIDKFRSIEYTPGARPKVAIFGDLYVRDNDVMNQGLIEVIERNGGEAVTTPYNEYMKIIAEPYLKKWLKEGYYPMVLKYRMMKKAIEYLEQKYVSMMNSILPEPADQMSLDYEKILDQLHIKPEHTGESMDNILKIFHLVGKYPDISLFIQTNPSYCCPSLVTEAMAERIESLTGVPIVTIEYDGTSGPKNDNIIPYIKYPRKIRKEKKHKAG